MLPGAWLRISKISASRQANVRLSGTVSLLYWYLLNPPFNRHFQG
jgi:hypothetical protein